LNLLISFPNRESKKDRAALPIKAYESQIVDAVRDNSVVIVAADTGVYPDCPLWPPPFKLDASSF
jgi:hypothetical protein